MQITQRSLITFQIDNDNFFFFYSNNYIQRNHLAHIIDMGNSQQMVSFLFVICFY